ncbi:MAG: serine hydrolase domain-containing protein [Dehalococcoidales bacterium]|jgi:CubicO group peptidase (beta-lactamase class C family)
MKFKNYAQIFIAVVLMITLAGCGQAAANTPIATGAAQPQNINDLLQPLLSEYQLPSVAAVVISNGQVVAQGAVGERKAGDSTPVTINDQYLLGSCTKAMTATIMGMLVQQGKLNWTSAMEDIFPEMKAEMLPQFRDVTILELLSMTAGLPSNLINLGYPPGTTAEYWQSLNEPVTQQRYEYTKDFLCEPDSFDTPPGSYEYSNVGYVIAAAVEEKVTGKSWNELMTDMLFKPLGMTTAGFGPMATGYEVNQPWQNYSYNNDSVPIPPDYSANLNGLTPLMYPAGGVHLSVLDWAKFITMQLEAENGGSTLLTPETAKVLHTPVDSGYALGWFVQPDYIWTNGVILTHNGFDGLDYAELWMSIKDNFAILVTTNSGSPEAPNIISNASAVLVHQFLPNQ